MSILNTMYDAGASVRSAIIPGCAHFVPIDDTEDVIEAHRARDSRPPAGPRPSTKDTEGQPRDGS